MPYDTVFDHTISALFISIHFKVTSLSMTGPSAMSRSSTQTCHVCTMCACVEPVSGHSGFIIVNCISLVIIPTVWPEHAMVCRLITCKEKRGVGPQCVMWVIFIISSRSITVHHFPVCCSMCVRFAFRAARREKRSRYFDCSTEFNQTSS